MANNDKPTSSSQFCQGKESFERMNFLYQAGTLMSGKHPKLSSYYGKLCRSVAQKAVLRMEPAVKRTICRRCGCILSAGLSAELRVNATNPKLCEYSCHQCEHARRFTINESYAESWLDDDRSVKERMHFDIANRNDRVANAQSDGSSTGNAEPAAVPRKRCSNKTQSENLKS